MHWKKQKVISTCSWHLSLEGPARNAYSAIAAIATSQKNKGSSISGPYIVDISLLNTCKWKDLKEEGIPNGRGTEVIKNYTISSALS